MRIKVYDNTFKKALRGKCSKVILLKFAVPIMLFVVVELVPLRGGNEFEGRLYNKILIPFRGVLEIFRRAVPSLF